MQSIDSGFCRPSFSGTGQAGATQGFKGFHGSFQDRADQFVRATVLADLGGSAGSGHGRHSHGIQGVAAAIAKALSSQDVTGTDAADDVLKQIETSLHKAAQAMADRGVDGETIDKTIDRFRAQLAGALDGMVKGATGGAGGANGSGASGSGSGVGSSAGSGVGSSTGSGSSGTSSGTSGSSGAAGSTGASGSSGATAGTGTNAPVTTSVSKFVAREVRKERGAIDLVTAEGDRVSIRFRSKEVVTGSVTQTTSSDGTTTTAAKSSVFSRGGMKIEVDGDLNEDEQKAIGDLLGKVDDIATQFFSGDVQAAFSAAGSLGVDSDQIAAYRLNLTYSRKVSAAYGAWGGSAPASTQPPATTGDGTTPAAGSGSTSGASDGAAAAGSGTASSASSNGASAGASDSDGGSANGSTGSSGATGGDSGSGSGTNGTPATGTATPPANTPPASAQKTIIGFINDALSKLGSVQGAGRLSFSTHWKMSVLVTAIQTVQPAQPTTPADQTAAANTQLLGDSLQKIASA